MLTHPRDSLLSRCRAVGFAQAHNPPAVSRLDVMDALGMLALDENRDYGGNRGQGGTTTESVEDELGDMRDLIKRDRSHPSVIWWSFCNEVGCNNESAAQPFREVSKRWDPTRAVTQNHYGSNLSTAFLDVQGFSHKHTSSFDAFKKLYPTVPMAATECCSCMSQRGVDQDVCPNPKDGGCTEGPKVRGTRTIL
jgi:beta-galactosidase/beta-glucuronidase